MNSLIYALTWIRYSRLMELPIQKESVLIVFPKRRRQRRRQSRYPVIPPRVPQHGQNGML